MKPSQELLTRIAHRDLYFLVLEVSGTFYGDEEENLKTQIRERNVVDLHELRISYQKINMGKKDQNGLYKNPVTYMVFVSKSGKLEEMSEEDLGSVAPSKISSEKMYIMLRNTPDSEKLEAWKSELKKFFSSQQYILHFD